MAMNPLKTLRLRLAAALSPAVMKKRFNRNVNYESDKKFTYVYKPDTLTYKDYDEMLRDPQIKSGYELLRLFLLSRSLRVTPASDSEEDAAIADFIEDMLHNLNYSLRKVRNDMYSALMYGFSVSEIIWGVNASEQLIIKGLEPLPPSTLTDPFTYNEEGEVETVTQTPPSGGEIEIPGEKCLIYTYDENFRDKTGQSILHSLYDYWYDKQRISNWRNVFLQKHEGPTLVGYVENPHLKDGMREQLDEIREGRANITVGKDDRVEILESSHRGEAFNTTLNHINTMFYRRMNLGTMILGQEDGKGAYAQSQTQEKILYKFLDGVHEDIASELENLIRRVVDLNFTVEKYPNITFTSFEEKDSLTLLKEIKPYIDNLAINPSERWFQELLRLVVEKYSDLKMEGMSIGEDKVGGYVDIVTPTPEDLENIEEKELSNLEEALLEIPSKEEE
jgi:hypothetical protein